MPPETTPGEPYQMLPRADSSRWTSWIGINTFSAAFHGIKPHLMPSAHALIKKEPSFTYKFYESVALKNIL